MNVWKKVIALIAAAIMLIRFLVFSCFAVGVAPVVAEELAEVLIALLMGAGHSQSELSGMSVTQMQSVLNDDINSGKINHGTILIDPITQQEMTVLDYFQSDTFKQDKAMYDLVRNSISDFIQRSLVGSDYYFTPTSTIDMMGHGAFYISDGTAAMGADYFIVDLSNGLNDVRIYHYQSGDSRRCPMYSLKNGKWVVSSGYAGNGWMSGYAMLEDGTIIHKSSGRVFKFYGDVRTIEGEPFPTDDEWEYQLGEIDGTKVTVDMLNPDGTVTIDGVTYYPADYLDPDKLTEEGKDALVDAIADAIDNTYVKTEEKPLVDEDDITVEVAEELEDFTVSPAIITVFPFCLPFDFVRGMKTLVQKPKVPVFKAELDLTNFCGYDLGKHTIEISFEKWEPAAAVCRWFFILLYVYTLILLTGKIVKGAGA